MNAAAYYRVSSRAQTFDMQRAAVERCAAARGDVLAAVYNEKRSGATTARPELERLRGDARAGRLPLRLYVFRLDRLTRSGIRDTFDLVAELRRCNVDLVSVADGFDVTGPAAEVVLAVMAWAAQMERLAINERIAAARERVEAEGGKWGRPPRMTVEQRALARLRFAKGWSVREISQWMSIPRATIGRAVGLHGRHCRFCRWRRRVRRLSQNHGSKSRAA